MQKFANLNVAALTLLGITCAASGPAQAALFWDPGITGASGGGATSGETTEWKTPGAGNVWYDGASNVAWTNGNDATFGGTAGEVRLGTTISAGTVDFDTAGYVINLRDFTDDAPRTLTLTGLSGSAATFRATQTPANGPAVLNLQMAADTVWGGNIGSGGDRLTVNVSGGKSLTVNQVIRNGGAFQQTLSITGTGTKLALSGTGSTYSGNRLNVGAGATFDLGSNGTFSARQLSLAATGTITATGTARIVDNNSFDDSSLAGLLTGTLEVQQSAGTMTISNNGNTYTGGTYLTAGTLNADANNALGTGVVQISNSSGTATLNFRSAAPGIGSLSSFDAGAKSVVLGNTGVDTTLTVNQSTAGSFAGVISQFSGRTGSLTKTGAAMLTLTGDNTYTGDTTINQGTLALGSAGELRFLIQNGNVSNSVLGSGTATFDGLFRLDISSLTDTGGVWNLVDVDNLTESFGGSFGLAFTDNTTFTNDGGGIYTSGDWTFNTGTGNLSLIIPEPAGITLLGLGALSLLPRRRS